MTLPTLRSGDTWSIEIPENSNYPNDEYIPHLRFRGETAFTLDGALNNLIITRPPAQSALHTSGIYDWVLYWTKGTNLYTDASGKHEILPNLLFLQGGYDARSHAQKMVPLIESALETFAVDGVQELEIAGRRYVKADVTKLRGLLQQYKNELADEQAEATGKTGKKILYAFQPVS